ncbi:MAG: invasin domain 3-containing protein, partial [Planctomycetota bacterium]
AGGCVVPSIEQAVLNTDGDIPAKLMAGMQAVRVEGGDGRCSCSPGNPTGCGCPPPGFSKSGHIGCMVVARLGNTDDPACTASGCADGDYLMKLNVPFQSSGSPDPVVQLQGLFDAWRADLVGHPDAVQSTVSFEPEFIPPNGVSTTLMRIELLDWQGLPATDPITGFGVQHAPDSDGLSTIGGINDNGDGTYDLVLTAGPAPGIDRFLLSGNDRARLFILTPNPTLQHFALGDLDGDGEVGVVDFLALLALWGPCPDPCIGDLDGDGEVGVTDFLILLAKWT